MRRLSEKQTQRLQQALDRQIEAMALRLGARKATSDDFHRGFYPFLLETRAGVYVFGGGHSLSLFGCFEDPKRAKEVCDCNPFSGKYNFHSPSIRTLADVPSFIQRVEHALQCLLPSEAT